MLKRSRRVGGRRTYRIEGAFAVYVGVAVFGAKAALSDTLTSRIGFALMAAALLWVVLACRLTVDDDGLVVQNVWCPRRVVWDDVRRLSMAPRWRSQVLILELRDRSVLRVWAVSVGVRAGTPERCRDVIADVKARHRGQRRR